MSIAFIIVNYMKAARLKESVLSILQCDKSVVSKIVVVDNSTDPLQASIIDSLPKDYRIKTVYSPSNIGYAAAVNLGAKYINPSDHVLLMSPDVIVEDIEILSGLERFFRDDSKLGILCPLQYNDDGTLVEVGRTFPTISSLVLRRIVGSKSRKIPSPSQKISDVDWAQSSFSLIRSDLWNKISGLDDRYFLFMSDTQLGADSWLAGYKVGVVDQGPGLRADGIRASAGGIRAIFKRTVRIHIVDALKYFLLGGAHTAARAKRLKSIEEH